MVEQIRTFLLDSQPVTFSIKTTQDRYELAGYDSWGENYNGNKDFEIEATEVEKVTVTSFAWEPV